MKNIIWLTYLNRRLLIDSFKDVENETFHQIWFFFCFMGIKESCVASFLKWAYKFYRRNYKLIFPLNHVSYQLNLSKCSILDHRNRDIAMLNRAIFQFEAELIEKSSAPFNGYFKLAAHNKSFSRSWKVERKSGG